MASVCFENCVSDSSCKGVTIDAGEEECVKHTSLPWMHGVICGGSCASSSSCSDQVCFAKGADMTSAAQYVDIGAGACARSGADETMPVLATTPYAASTSGWSVVQTNCQTACDNNANCRSYSVGKRTCVSGGSSVSEEHVCQLYSNATDQAVQDSSRMTANVCTDACTGDTGGSCVVPTAGTDKLKCVAKSYLSAKDFIFRANGVCSGATWGSEASWTQEVALDASRTSPGPERYCQQQCASVSSCKGVGIVMSTNTSQGSFCRLYTEDVVAGDLRPILAELCPSDCGSSGTPCACTENSPPPYDCTTCTHQLCCSSCATCAQQYTPLCFTYSRA